jgi:hypothetical protein
LPGQGFDPPHLHHRRMDYGRYFAEYCYNTTMAKNKNLLTSFRQYKLLSRLLTYTGILLLVVSGWLWWSRIYTDPQRVFTAMLENSLSTPSVTRHVTQAGQGNTLDQYIELDLGAQNLARITTTLGQGSGDAAAKVVTESIGTTGADYTRYLFIDTNERNSQGQALSFDDVIGVWAKNDEPQSGQASNNRYFNEALLGVVPFANLDTGQRESLLRTIQDKGVFKTELAAQGRQNGRRVYVYKATITPRSYIEMLQSFTKALGLGAVEGLEQENYEGVAPLNLELSVDVLSRQLVGVGYPANGRQEVYSGHGLKRNVTLPEETIPVSELQQRLQNLR